MEPEDELEPEDEEPLLPLELASLSVLPEPLLSLLPDEEPEEEDELVEALELESAVDEGVDGLVVDGESSLSLPLPP